MNGVEHGALALLSGVPVEVEIRSTSLFTFGEAPPIDVYRITAETFDLVVGKVREEATSPCVVPDG